MVRRTLSRFILESASADKDSTLSFCPSETRYCLPPVSIIANIREEGLIKCVM